MQLNLPLSFSIKSNAAVVWDKTPTLVFIVKLQLTQKVFPALCSELCSLGGLVQRCRCTLRAGGCGKVGGCTFIISEHREWSAGGSVTTSSPLLPLSTLLQGFKPPFVTSPTTALTFFCTQMRTLISCCYVADSQSFTFLLTMFEPEVTSLFIKKMLTVISFF